MAIQKIKIGDLKGYMVCGVVYKRQADLIAEIRRILHSAVLNTPILGEDKNILLELLNAHQDYSGKYGVGIASIVVRNNLKYHQPEFWIIREDNSETDFSFFKCISSLNSSTYVKRAFRIPIESHIDEYRLSYLRQHGDGTQARCEHCEIMVMPQDSHIDHIPPDSFDKLLEQFLLEYGLNNDDIELTASADGQIGRQLADEGLAENWQKFHRARARLRYVGKFCNLSAIKLEDATFAVQAERETTERE